MRIRRFWARQRTWRPEQAVLPEIRIEEQLVHIQNVRNFTFRSADDFTPDYQVHTYHLDRLEQVWFVVAPFTRDWRGPAHTFLSFGFSDAQYVSISVEARREVGQAYSLWKGALRQYELIYVIGEERDLIGLRAAVWDTPVYLYPIRATSEQIQGVFVQMLKRAQALAHRPEFYNTLTNNCTTNILDAVNVMASPPIPFGIKVLLPGYSDALAFERGLIDTALSLEAARTRFQVNERAKAAMGALDFSARIRALG